MDKGELAKELQALISTLQDHENHLKKLTEDLQLILRPTGDVTFGALERTNEVLSSFKEAKDAAARVKTILKARANERMKGI